jgi:hypothetical protein
VAFIDYWGQAWPQPLSHNYSNQLVCIPVPNYGHFPELHSLCFLIFISAWNELHCDKQIPIDYAIQYNLDCKHFWDTFYNLVQVIWSNVGDELILNDANGVWDSPDFNSNQYRRLAKEKLALWLGGQGRQTNFTIIRINESYELLTSKQRGRPRISRIEG